MANYLLLICKKKTYYKSFKCNNHRYICIYKFTRDKLQVRIKILDAYN
jgi:hypothetical protein